MHFGVVLGNLKKEKERKRRKKNKKRSGRMSPLNCGEIQGGKEKGRYVHKRGGGTYTFSV